jgi:hypothetical protein
MDVKSDFLNGSIKQEVYVEQSPVFESDGYPNHVKNAIYSKFYPCFMIQMVSSYIYMCVCVCECVGVCFKTCPRATHIYILFVLRQNLLNIKFLGSF